MCIDLGESQTDRQTDKTDRETLIYGSESEMEKKSSEGEENFVKREEIIGFLPNWPLLRPLLR